MSASFVEMKVGLLNKVDDGIFNPRMIEKPAVGPCKLITVDLITYSFKIFDM